MVYYSLNEIGLSEIILIFLFEIYVAISLITQNSYLDSNSVDIV